MQISILKGKNNEKFDTKKQFSVLCYLLHVVGSVCGDKVGYSSMHL